MLFNVKKKVVNWHGHQYFYLGRGVDGVDYYLEKESWDCGWYWGCGIITSFTNQRCPEKSRDINGWTHVDSLFFNKNCCASEAFVNFFKWTVLDTDDIYTFCDYFMSIYNLRKSAEIFRYGFSWQTSRAKLDTLVKPDIVKEINEKMLPELFKKVNSLLS